VFIKSPDALRALWQGREVPIRVGIETGTFRGVSAERLSPAVKTWHTIDINPGCTQLARRRCGESGRTNVYFHTGDSRVLLAKLLRKNQEACLIMLDAHFSKVKRKLFEDEPTLTHSPDGGDFPLLKELETIAPRPYADIVIVDDTALFGKDRPDLRATGDKGQIIDKRPQWESMTRDKVASLLGRVCVYTDFHGTTVYWRFQA